MKNNCDFLRESLSKFWDKLDREADDAKDIIQTLRSVCEYNIKIWERKRGNEDKKN
tara:strand:+ start:740 stop:907 length:168 start_codon:yes stop_codon:yes gene_type:complete